MPDDPYRAPGADQEAAQSSLTKRGRWLFWIVCGGSLAFEAAIAIGALVRGSAEGLLVIGLVRLGFLSPLYFLHAGARWPRFPLFLVYGLQTYGIARMVPTMTLSFGCAQLIGSGLFLLWAMTILLLSPALEAFMTSQRRARGA